MFRVQDNVPDVYIQESRDFQLLSRLYDLVFQSSRFSINTMEDLSDTAQCSENILPLLQTKLGFFKDTSTTNDVLRKVLTAYPYIIRYKGSEIGIELCMTLFNRITHNAIESWNIVDSDIVVHLKRSIQDSELLRDLLSYILPVGSAVKFTIETTFELDTDRVHVSNAVRYEGVSVPPLTSNDNATVGNTQVSEEYNNQRKDQ